MVTIRSGVNEVTLNVAGQSVSSVKNSLKSVLNLSGNETVRVNGRKPAAGRILKSGDNVEFVKQTGTKGSVNVTSGVNDLNLELDGVSVATARHQLKSVLNLTEAHVAQVNGRTVDPDATLKNGDRLEFVKRTGTKGN